MDLLELVEVNLQKLLFMAICIGDYEALGVVCILMELNGEKFYISTNN